MTFYYVLSLSTILLLKITMVSIRKSFLFTIIFPRSPEFHTTLSSAEEENTSKLVAFFCTFFHSIM